MKSYAKIFDDGCKANKTKSVKVATRRESRAEIDKLLKEDREIEELIHLDLLEQDIWEF